MENTRTDRAPAPLGPYEQAVTHNGTVYVSMQLPIPADGKEKGLQNIEEQTELVLENIKAILKASGSSIESVLKITVYMSDISNGKRVNKIYEKFFPIHKPARTSIGVASLPFGYNIAMDAIAVVEK